MYTHVWDIAWRMNKKGERKKRKERRGRGGVTVHEDGHVKESSCSKERSSTRLRGVHPVWDQSQGSAAS